MPLPKPSLGESRDEFVGRCISDDKVTSEFPDRDQRVAVCISQFEGGKMSEQQRLTLRNTLRITKQSLKR